MYAFSLSSGGGGSGGHKEETNARLQVVPVERTMNKDKQRYPLLLDLVLCLVTLMLGSFGILVTSPALPILSVLLLPFFFVPTQGYLTYGDETKDVITLNLPGRIGHSLPFLCLFEC